MALSSELISQLAKATKPAENKPTEATVFGTTILGENGDPFVQIDGSDAITPVTSTVRVNPGERVVVRIGNHSAVVMGNMTTPSASTDDVEDLADEITELEVVVAEKVSTEELDAVLANIDTLIANDVTITGRLDASEASIAELEAGNVTITGRLDAAEATIGHLETDKLDASVADITFATIEDLTAINAVINNLDATYATIEYLDANYATIQDLDAVNATIENLDATFANIDFANIGEAAIENLFAKSGMIEDMIVSEGHVTGTLVGVTILGDYIKGGTIQADSLILMGPDGLYYRMNVTEGGVTAGEQISEEDLQGGIHGSIIVANSVTAEKIYVDDLAAFDATIGGFQITDSSIHSIAKASVDNTTRGVYLGKDGQVAVGDATNYLKFYEDENGDYKLDISAASMTFSSTGQTVEELVGKAQDFENRLTKYIKITGENAIEIGSGDSAITLEIDNENGISFKKEGVEFGSWDGNNFYTGNIVVRTEERAQFGNFAFVPRSDGSLSFLKVGE
jgi:hypothetical protein